MAGALLHCPIRGQLTVSEKAKDGITFTEEKRRIDCIKFLLQKGYPSSHFLVETTLLRFGHMGKNSFRTDLAILDVPASSVPNDVETVRKHAKLIAEIKRGNADSKRAKKTQVEPALAFLDHLTAVGIYWDDIEQRLFYRTVDEYQRTVTHETTAAALPKWGQSVGAIELRLEDLRTTNLTELFKKIEDILHSSIQDKSRRYGVMLQILLVKLYDEYIHPSGNAVMTLQDFSDAPVSDSDIVKIYNDLLKKGMAFYGKFLPKSTQIGSTFQIPGNVLRDVSALLAPVRILSSKREVIQSFYMYFAKAVYKWDLAQYFTPIEVIDFIVALVNPQAGDTIKDPACGSGDFLIASFQYADRFGVDLRQAVWGADSSENAVDICVVNMILNGDGKGQVRQENSLANVERYDNEFSVVLCNPPFGSKIVERDFEVLRKFDLGHQWSAKGGTMEKTEAVATSQELGVLFAELCVRQVQPGGRVGIILPNGYLGNKSGKYIALREWLLRHTRLVGVVGFPRFTFKKSGADVSASVLVMEKREVPLVRAADSEDYPVYIGIIESVGWSVSDKRADPQYLRDQETGDFVMDTDNEPVLDADFGRVLQDIHSSNVTSVFPWMVEGLNLPANACPGWNVAMKDIVTRSDLSIDPKRWCERSVRVREQIDSLPHFRIGDVADVVPQGGIPTDRSAVYEYVEIGDTNDGIVTPTRRRGWELPSRARHRADTGDIFVGSIWGSVSSWFVAGGDTTSLVVSNGFLRLKMKPEMEHRLVDLIAGINTEAYRIQARAAATGSDGLAEVSDESLKEICLPELTDPLARATIETVLESLLRGRPTVASVVNELIEEGAVQTADFPPRRSNWVQV